MKVIVAGGRDLKLIPIIFKLDELSARMGLDISEIVSGCCKGVDEAGEFWAKKKGISIRKFPADWDAHGKAAGPIRNRQMAEYADTVILFPGGKGTASMKREAQKAGIDIIEVEK